MYSFYNITSGICVISTNERLSGFVDGGTYLYMKDTNSWQLVSFQNPLTDPEICIKGFSEKEILLFEEKSIEF
jgi:hypothetical protein